MTRYPRLLQCLSLAVLCEEHDTLVLEALEHEILLGETLENVIQDRSSIVTSVSAAGCQNWQVANQRSCCFSGA